VSVTELEHVLVLSDDIDRSRNFYERALGLEPGARPGLPFDGYWLYAGAIACLHIADRASYRVHASRLGLPVGERSGGPGPVDHIAFNGSDYESFERRLLELGIEPVRNEVPGGGPRQLFFDDPDGVRVEVNVKP
jgi:catechol 2,3-dioxygenase-like lactoylglutathione lyase family enzyme